MPVLAALLASSTAAFIPTDGFFVSHLSCGSLFSHLHPSAKSCRLHMARKAQSIGHGWDLLLRMGHGGNSEADVVVPLLSSAEQLQSALSMAGAAGYGTMILFKKDMCRKCAALSPKFERLPRTYARRATAWVMVNADKLTKEERAEWMLKTVPSIHYVGSGGECLEQFEAVGSIVEVVERICEIEEKLATMLEPGVNAMSLEDLGFKVPEAPPRKTAGTGRIISAAERDERAGALKSKTIIVQQ